MLLANGGGHAPPTHALFGAIQLFEAIHASEKKTSHHVVCARRRLCGSCCLQMERAAPPPTPRFFKAINVCKKWHVSCLPVRIILFAPYSCGNEHLPSCCISQCEHNVLCKAPKVVVYSNRQTLEISELACCD